VYLQSARGGPIGPLPTQWLELLFHAGVIDHATPISLNGSRWRAIGDWGEMAARLREMEQEVARGHNPWPLVLPRDPGGAPSGPIGTGAPAPSQPTGPPRPGVGEASGSVPPDSPRIADAPPSADLPHPRPQSASAPAVSPAFEPRANAPSAAEPSGASSASGATLDLPQTEETRTFEGPPLAAWLSWAAQRATGVMVLERSSGPIRVALRGGKVARVECDEPDLALAKHLVARDVVSAEALQVAAGRAPDHGGDLGAALVASGTVAPDRFVSAFVEWALSVLAAFVIAPARRVQLEPARIEAPAVPLGLSRFGALIQTVRSLPRNELASRLLPARTRPLIVSQVEGVRIEDLELRPRELRTLNSINGAKTIGDITDAVGGDDEKSETVLRLLFFATESGLAVMGEDPFLKQELAEAEQIQKELQKIEGWGYFDILGIPKTTTDDEVRTRYKELVKKYHPDRLRPEAAPSLREVRQRMFGIVSEAFAQLETESRRKRYLEEGDRSAESRDLIKAQNALQAETCFKKAEVLMRVRKYDEAIEQIRQALELNPHEPEFVVFDIYLDYLIRARSDDSTTLIEETIEAIRNTLRSQPNMLSAHLFIAQLHKLAGNTKLMLKSYRKVLEVDSNHPEANQELRLEQLRREKEKKKKGWFG